MPAGKSIVKQQFLWKITLTTVILSFLLNSKEIFISHYDRDYTEFHLGNINLNPHKRFIIAQSWKILTKYLHVHSKCIYRSEVCIKRVNISSKCHKHLQHYNLNGPLLFQHETHVNLYISRCCLVISRGSNIARNEGGNGKDL